MAAPSTLHPSSTPHATERSPLLDHESSNVIEDVETRIPRNHSDVTLAQSPGTLKLLLIMSSCWFGCFLAALDSTIVATLGAPIATSFQSFTLLSWIAASYLIANAAFTPLSGKLTDIFGRRAGLISCNALFFTGNLICGLAKTPEVMIFGRVIQGLGGGGINSISTFIASDLIPLRQRGLWQGIGNLCWGLGSGLGGVYGGWINDLMGWRWAFLIQCPCIAISAVLVFFNVHIPVKEKDVSRIKRVDFLGSFLLVASLVLLLMGLNSGGNTVPWSHPLVISSIIASVVTLCIFVYVEDQVAPEPIIPVRLLLNRTVAAACLTNWFQSMAQYGILYYVPIYFQVNGMSATRAGARLVPQAFGTAIGGMLAGYGMRITGRYYALMMSSEASRLMALILIAVTLVPGSPMWPPFIYLFITGTSYTVMLVITLLALIAAVDHEHQAVITSASYACRATGSTIGITIASAVFQNILKSELWRTFGDQPGAADEIGRIRDSVDEIKSLPIGWYPGVLDSYVTAFRSVWWTCAGLAVLGMVSSAFMREHKLHATLERK
ncbi:MFS multidrug transporter [Pseudovirgaria hyperparasitica]|uniref:MFS multidrug transporter n=1 Tax=Pseudovirgaria hyperparasitica TaxID=470096 RepID=A0A6A6VYM2_9PEZI|nr:MFS multidrug transporter [Pseudovirgaria hyperparasitica]KAF2755758.1 MFS multidrug transporter [Pseudovirgaria hyperparasitica]